jgi:hypothetical protein
MAGSGEVPSNENLQVNNGRLRGRIGPGARPDYSYFLVAESRGLRLSDRVENLAGEILTTKPRGIRS